MCPIIILSAPSSCGKNVIAAAILRNINRLERVVTATTRPPRPKERQNRDYYFWTKQLFEKKIAQGAMFEWAHVHDHLYGIPYSAIQKIIHQGKIPLLVIDVQGAHAIRKKWSMVVSIFVKPESLAVMKTWLIRRGRNTPEEITLRLQSAKKELKALRYYDHVVLNRDGRLKEVIQEIEDIIKTALDKKAKKV